MGRMLVVACAALVLIAGLMTPAAAQTCRITAFAAFCDENNDYVLHCTWEDDINCDAKFVFEYRVYPSGAWQSVPSDGSQTAVWTPPETGSYQFRVTLQAKPPCACVGTGDCTRMYPLDGGLQCGGDE